MLSRRPASILPPTVRPVVPAARAETAARPAAEDALPADSPPAAVAAAVPAATEDDIFDLEGVIRRGRRLLDDLRDPDQRTPWIVIGLVAALLVYSYWPGLMNAAASWNNPQYSHGWIVPLFSLALLFWYRQPTGPVTPSARMIGLAVLVGSFALRLACARFRIVTIDMYTLVPALMGLFLLAGGWSMFRWSWAPLAALIFMYPLPDEATRYLLGPLQTLATMVSTFALQTLGYDAVRDGNRIVLGDDQVLGVVDACSGLRMLTIFVWLAVVLVLVGGRDWWENGVILVSAIPIALIVNSIRITITGMMYTVNPEWAEKIFHDWAGYFMMPLALGLLFGLQFLLQRLVLADPTPPMASLGGPLARPASLPGAHRFSSTTPRDSGPIVG